MTRLDGTRFSNYHTSAGVDGVALNGGSGGYGSTAAVPPALAHDFDPQDRSLTAPAHRGADQVTGFIAPPVATNDTAATALNTPVIISVLANDTPAPLVVTSVSLLVGGTATTDGTNVAYTPTAGFTGLGSFAYTISGAGGEASATVAVTVGGGGGATPVLSLTPSAVNFAAVNVGATSLAQVVTVANTGNATMSIGSIALGGAPADVSEYTLVNGCAPTLAAGASCTASLTFHPTSIGAKLATLDVSTDGGNGSVSLTGIGVGAILAATPSSLAFGNQLVNVTSPALNVTLTNTGNALAEFSTSLTGANPARFSVVGTSCPAMPSPNPNRFLVAGGSCTVSVTFTPHQPAAQTATLAVTPTVGTALNVGLTGTGVQGTVTFSAPPPWVRSQAGHRTLAFGDLSVPSTSTVTLTNTGTAPVTTGRPTVRTLSATRSALERTPAPGTRWRLAAHARSR